MASKEKERDKEKEKGRRKKRESPSPHVWKRKYPREVRVGNQRLGVSPEDDEQEADLMHSYATNYVRTGKYTVWSFIPINLFEQFQQFANFYFLIVGTLQIFKDISTTQGVPTLYIPLTFILSVSAVRAALEDYQRHVEDAREAAIEYLTLCWDPACLECHPLTPDTAAPAEPDHERGGAFHPKNNGNLQVGDLVLVRESDMVPADLVVLASSAERGHCFVETANLDGETSLKVKNSVPMSHTWFRAMRTQAEESGQGLPERQGTRTATRTKTTLGEVGSQLPVPAHVMETWRDVEINMFVEDPNADFDSLRGVLAARYRPSGQPVPDWPWEGATNDQTGDKLGEAKESEADDTKEAKTDDAMALCGLRNLEAAYMILRGTQLRNTDWVLGMVTYTGIDTKIRRNVDFDNKRKVPMSTMMRKVNKYLLRMFYLQVAVCIMGGVWSAIFVESNKDAWYLALEGEHAAQEFVLRFFTWFIIMSQMIPIALVVTAELVKVMQAWFIAQDIMLYDQDKDMRTVVRTNPVIEDLGMVDHVFSDKTGTLTQNKMTFRVAYVGSTSFGSSETEISRRVKIRRLRQRMDELQLTPAAATTSLIGRELAMAGDKDEKSPSSSPDGSPDAQVRNLFTLLEEDRRSWIELTDGLDSNPVCADAGDSTSTTGSTGEGDDTKMKPTPAKPDSTKFDGGAEVKRVLWGESTQRDSSELPDSSAGDACNTEEMYRFMIHMAISNTITPLIVYEEADEGSEEREAASASPSRAFHENDEDGLDELYRVMDPHRDVVFQASSPDELCLCNFARDMGFCLVARNPTTVLVTREDGSRYLEKFRHLATLDFNSKRKRVTLIYEQAGNVLVMSKGADSNILPLLRRGNRGFAEVGSTLGSQVRSRVRSRLSGVYGSAGIATANANESHGPGSSVRSKERSRVSMNAGRPSSASQTAGSQFDMSAVNKVLGQLSENGLRTLVVAYSDLSVIWWDRVKPMYEALKLLPEKDAELGHTKGACTSNCQICHMMNDIEESAQMMLCGCTAIEDELQELVPECIRDLREGNIKVWMLTGDKRQTAKNIALACNLIDPDMEANSQSSWETSRLIEVTGRWTRILENRQDLQNLFDLIDYRSEGRVEVNDVLYFLKEIGAPLMRTLPRRITRFLEHRQQMARKANLALQHGSVPPPPPTPPPVIPVQVLDDDVPTDDSITLVSDTDDFVVEDASPMPRLRLMTDYGENSSEVDSKIAFSNISHARVNTIHGTPSAFVASPVRRNMSLDDLPHAFDPSVPTSAVVNTPWEYDEEDTSIDLDTFIRLMEDCKPTMLECIASDIRAGVKVAMRQRRAGLMQQPIGMVLEGRAFQSLYPDLSKMNCAEDGSDKDNRGQCEEVSSIVKALRSQFFKLASQCSSVVCCRLSPHQKALIVREVKAREDVVTLAIGDGANDEQMILEADIGVGLQGQEGSAAARAADFAIGRFRFLHTLLFVHGVWNNRRTALLTLYLFYKSVLPAIVLYYFGFFSGFSGQPLFNDPVYNLYSIMFTALPIMVVAVLDRHLKRETLENTPRVYRYTKEESLFGLVTFTGWMWRALWHAAVLFFLVSASLGTFEVRHDGKTHGLWMFGTVIYAAVVSVVNFRVLLEMRSLTWMHHASVWLSLVVFYLATWVLSLSISLNPDYFNILFQMFRHRAALFTLVLATSAPILIDYGIKAIWIELAPSHLDVIRERETLSPEERNAKLQEDRVAEEEAEAFLRRQRLRRNRRRARHAKRRLKPQPPTMQERQISIASKQVVGRKVTGGGMIDAVGSNVLVEDEWKQPELPAPVSVLIEQRSDPQHALSLVSQAMGVPTPSAVMESPEAVLAPWQSPSSALQ